MTHSQLDPPDDRGGRALAGLPGEAAAQSRPVVPARDVVAQFEVFYRAETRNLVRLLVWMGASLPDAADVAQDTMISAFQQWQKITTPRAWIRRVASRTFLRRQLARVEQPTDTVDGRPLLRNNADLSAWEDHDEVRRQLAGLPSRQRQVMAWTFDGYTPQEIAAELGITAEAVRSNLRLARRTLAQRLPDLGGPR